MRRNTLSRLVFLSVALAAASCAPKKDVVVSAAHHHEVSRGERREVLGQIDRHRLAFTTFSGRAKARVVMGKDDYDFTANVRIRRDSAIWISFSALMNIEAGRLLITPDSIKLVNRLRSEYAVMAFDYVRRVANNRLDFYALQAFLVGDVPQGATDDPGVWMSESGYMLRSREEGGRWDVLIGTGSRPLRIELETDRQQLLEAAYGNYREEAGRLFPSRLAISVSADPFVLRADMDYTRLSFDDLVEMPFNIPATYSEIR